MAQYATDSPFHSLLRACGLIRRVMEPYFARAGINASLWAALRVLQRAEADGVPGLRLSDIGARLLIRPPSVTAVVTRLRRLKLVAYTVAAEDRRVKRVSLTETGHALIERMREGHQARIELIFQALSPEERSQLHRLLDRLGTRREGLANQEEAPAVLVEADGASAQLGSAP